MNRIGICVSVETGIPFPCLTSSDFIVSFRCRYFKKVIKTYKIKCLFEIFMPKICLKFAFFNFEGV